MIVPILDHLSEIGALIGTIWEFFITLLTLFIHIPIKIFEYLILFSSYFLVFLEILFNIILYCITHIWFLVIIYVGIICIQTYFQHPNSPHERLIAFFHNLFTTGFYIIKHMFYIFKILYELSLKILMKIIEMIPVFQ